MNESLLSKRDSSDRLFWLLSLIGIIALYLPTYLSAANSIWKTEEHGHGPIILGVLFWLGSKFWKKIKEVEPIPKHSHGALLLVLGLIFYMLGRAFNISSIEFFSHALIIPAVLLLGRGVAALRMAWFPILYIIFLVPLPGSFVDAVTQPLKGWISTVVVELLSGVGYPIARSGVIITVGQYQLLVADACSGLHSMFSLAALGSLFMFISDRKSIYHNCLMMALILPIAFAANLIRVIILIMITYHLGDEWAQGFLHGAAGIFLMLLALILFFLIDYFIIFVSKLRRGENNL